MSWKLLLFEIKPPANPEALADITPLLQRLEKAFGTRRLAKLLGNKVSIVVDCVAGRRQMSAEMAHRVLDLHEILTRAFQVFSPDTAMRWLVGSEPLLGGSRPIDVLVLRGVAPLIEALDGIDSGAYT